MKKLKLIFLLFPLLTNCEKIKFEDQKDFKSQIFVNENMLQIKNSTAFLDLIDFLKKSETKTPHENLAIILGEINYKKLTRFNKRKKKSYEINPIDTIVTEPLFSSLLNCNGEIRVENTIYRITPFGTFMFLPEKKKFVDSLILKLESTTHKSSQFIS